MELLDSREFPIGARVPVKVVGFACLKEVGLFGALEALVEELSELAGLVLVGCC